MLWVLDLDGVVWLAGQPIPGSADAVARLRDAVDRVVFVTNNSTPTIAEHLERLGKVGVTATADDLATSAQAAAAEFAEGSRVACVGGPGLAEALGARRVDTVAASDKPEAVIVGRSLRLDFDELSHASQAIRAGARFVATNTDATFPTPSGLEPGAGALVAYLEVASGRRAEPAGKPCQPMADLIVERFGRPDVVVGDRPDTDGLFAERVGAAFALVLSGVTSRSDLPVTPEPASVSSDLAEAVAARLGSKT